MTVFLCLSVVLLSLLASGVDLHGLVHADAGDANHHCVISMFANGQVDLTQVSVSIAPSVTTIVFAPLEPVHVFVRVPRFCLLPERAPPVFSGSFAV